MVSHRSRPGSSPAARLSARARALLLASLAALVATTFDANAAPSARPSTTTGHAVAAPDSLEFGSRRRARRGDAAALAMMGMMVGTIGAVIAAEQRRDAYQRVYYDYPYGYHHRPRVYRHPYAYAPRYYEPRRRHHRPRVYHQPRTYAPNPAWHDRLQRIDPHNPNSANPTGVPRIGW